MQYNTDNYQADRFTVYTMQKSWHQAREYCMGEGMRLAVIKTRTEEAYLMELVILC